MDVSRGEHGIKPRQSFGSLGEHHRTAYRSVETVYYPHEYSTRFGISLLDEFFESFHQRFVAGLVALHDFSGTLVYNNNMIVLVEYLHKLC